MTKNIIRIYRDQNGRVPYTKWLESIRDSSVLSDIERRIDRLAAGNPGNFKYLGNKVYELKLDFGPGYRIYYGYDGLNIVLLLCGGDKSTQQKDVAKAKKYWKIYKENKNAKLDII